MLENLVIISATAPPEVRNYFNNLRIYIKSDDYIIENYCFGMIKIVCIKKLTCEFIVEVDNERFGYPVMGGEKREKTKKGSQWRTET